MAKAKPSSLSPANLSSVLNEVKRNYQQQDDNFDRAYKLCTTDAQRTILRACLNSARDVFWMTVDKSLSDNNELVKRFGVELREKNDVVKGELKQLQNVAAYLDLVAEATKLAAAVVSLALA